MTSSDDFSGDFSMDCKTCIGAGTTACSGCIVTHLLANDDGPIDYVPVRLVEVPRVPDANEAAVGLFVQAGLLADPVEFVSMEEFASFDVVATV